MPSEFPLPSVSGSNPKPLIWYQLPEEFQVNFTEYDDGGRDTVLQSGGSGIKRWVLNYDGLTETEAAVLDAHALSARLDENGFSAYSFNYRDRDGTLYSFVRYEKYERPAHQKKWAQARNIQLAKFL